ncbi:MAG: hypothetical protein ACYTE8_05615 [Planctomycetota bacterium]|jgi:ABC-type multidrug transport system fused ATPase/permease subunit
MNSEKESPIILGRPVLFTQIFRTFGIATRMWNLLICFLALIVICLAGFLLDLTKPVVVAKGIHGNSELEVYLNNPDHVDSYLKEHKDDGQRKGVFTILWHFGEQKFQKSVKSVVFDQDVSGVVKHISDFFKALIWSIKHHFVYSVIFFAISLGMISIAGGAVCRTAALQFAQGQKPGMTEALRYSLKKFTSYFSAPLTPICFIIICGFFIFIVGLLETIPWGIGEIIMVIFMLLALISGVFISVLLIGAVAGFNLMFPSIAYEGTDSFGAMNHSFCYIYKKPWRMSFYTTIAAVYGAIGYAFVRFFVFILLWSTHQSLQLGSRFVASIGKLFGNDSAALSKFTAIWPEPAFMNLFGTAVSEPSGWSQIFAFYMVHLMIWLFIIFLAAFIMSFYFSANSIIYALIRNRVDNTPTSDIYTRQELEESELNLTEQASAESKSTENESVEEPKAGKTKKSSEDI